MEEYSTKLEERKRVKFDAERDDEKRFISLPLCISLCVSAWEDEDDEEEEEEEDEPFCYNRDGNAMQCPCR